MSLPRAIPPQEQQHRVKPQNGDTQSGFCHHMALAALAAWRWCRCPVGVAGTGPAAPALTFRCLAGEQLREAGKW